MSHPGPPEYGEPAQPGQPYGVPDPYAPPEPYTEPQPYPQYPPADQYGRPFPQPGYPGSAYPAPGHPTPGYPAPGYPAPGYPQARPTSGTAVGSLVCGLAGLFTCGLLSIVAIVLGHMSLRETRTGQVDGRGMAITGLVLGYVVLFSMVIGLIVMVLVWIGLLASIPLFGTTPSSSV